MVICTHKEEQGDFIVGELMTLEVITLINKSQTQNDQCMPPPPILHIAIIKLRKPNSPREVCTMLSHVSFLSKCLLSPKVHA